VALPAGYETHATDPVKSMDELLSRQGSDADRWIVACAIAAQSDRRESLKELLCSHLCGAGDDRGLAIMAALRQLTGDREMGLNRAAWVGYATRLLESKQRNSKNPESK
jgi:hypothetical protein